MIASNHPAAGRAGIALLFAFVHHTPDLPEPRDVSHDFVHL